MTQEQEARVTQHLPLVTKLAAALTKRYRIPPQLFEDLVSEGYLVLVSLAKEETTATQAARAIRNTMAAFAMRELRRSRKEVTQANPPVTTAPDAELVVSGELTKLERLAVLAWSRGISFRDIECELGVGHGRLEELIRQTAELNSSS